MKLTGKVALVTGSSNGIGAGIAKGFAAEGAEMIINYYSDKDGAERTAKAVREHSKEPLIIQADVSSSKDVERMFKEIKQKHSRLDILVNNAGITSIRSNFDKLQESEWDRVINTNLKSMFYCCKQTVPIMPKGGAILNISSFQSTSHLKGWTAYAASKGGIDAFTRCLAIDLAEKGIRVNALRPGLIEVEREILDRNDPSFQMICDRIPVGRPGNVQDCVPVSVLLCSDDAGFITGQTFCVDGGQSVLLSTPYARGFSPEI
jgi:NAD(P)-dependent dehydrogenase (short-subunit alcohol dehydrogenase family)